MRKLAKMKNAMYSGLCKLMQKQTYDVLSHRHGTIIIIVGIILIIVSAFQFGETALEWSQDKYEAVFNSFSDNVAGRSFQNRLCQPVPIDIVYTWVNGTDPKMLAELRHYKMSLESEINKTSGKPSCPFHHCIPWNFVVMEPAIPPDITMDTFSILYPAFKEAKRVVREVIGDGEPSNITIVWFETIEQAELAAKSKVKIENSNATVAQGHLTSDWPLPNSILSKELIIMSGFPNDFTSEKLKERFPDNVQKVITKVELYGDKGMAVIEISDHDILQQITEGKVNITFDGKEPIMTAASLMWDLTDYRHNDVLSANRFQDNEELRYSLRSVERYAPWVRHVYIVTNGQIPAWLNLDNPRLTIITHEEIFVNKSHLPTFASPAIETHLHHIPGLSDKFIYLNDDVMFGKEVWPEDFYTHSNGQKVYLTWPVPDCQEGCPGSWIKDGYCDKACNNSACEWDGGDCAAGAGRSGIYDQGGNAWGAGTEDLYCSSGCANNWLADRYCDESCNVQICGFDAGDCGVHNFHRLHSVDIHKNGTLYRFPRGVSVVYLNLTHIYGSDGTIEEGTYEDNPAVRAATLSQKFKTMSIVLYKKFNETVLNITIRGKELNGTVFDFQFNVTMDPWPLAVVQTKPKKKEEKPSNATQDGAAAVNITKIEFKFDNVAEELRQPIAIEKRYDFGEVKVMNLTLYELPEDISKDWRKLVKALKEGDITEKGFTICQTNLTKLFLEKLAKEGKEPELRKVEPEPVKAVENNSTESKVKDKVEGEGQIEKAVERNSTQSKVKGHDQGQVDSAKRQAMDALVQGGGDNLNDPEVKLDEKVDHQRKDDDNLPLQGKPDDGVDDQNKPHETDHKLHDDNGEKPGEADGQLVEQHHPEAAQDDTNQEIEKVQLEQPLREQKEEEILGQPNELENKKEDPAAFNQSETFKSRKLNGFDLENVGPDDSPGFLPWEKHNSFAELNQAMEQRDKRDEYSVEVHSGRRLLDTFAESLRHTNRLYNQAYGYAARKVPAHMPHMIDKHVMGELQAKFPKEWADTSAHALRSPYTMQFSFSYMYYLMSEKKEKRVEEIFDIMDTDRSRVLSDREVRTLATRLYELPLDLQTLTGLEAMMINCSKHLPESVMYVSSDLVEVYYDKSMPQVTRSLVIQCPALVKIMKEKFPDENKYRHEIVNDEEVAFKMIETNVSRVVGQLDDIRKNPKKFICLNDNLDHTKEHAQMVKAVLHDFYESILPVPSSFELPREYRNRFLRMDELREWRKYRDWLKLWTQVALFVLIMYTIWSFFSEKIEAMQRKYLGRRGTAGGQADGEKEKSPSVVIQL